MKNIDLSVVIPAYNESARLPRSLERVHEYLKGLARDFELLVVDDGSRDGTAEVAAQMLSPLGKRGRVLRHHQNLGKGASVRNGMLAARGSRVLFSDADLSTPIEEVEKLERALDGGAGIAIGSRSVDRRLIEQRQSLARDMTGRLFNLVVRLCAVRGIGDTQCGFKLFTRDVVGPVFERTRLDRFGFDVEVLAIAQRLGIRIAEVPVRWRDRPGSRVTLVQGGRAFLDPLRVRLGLLTGRYGLHDSAERKRGQVESDPQNQ